MVHGQSYANLLHWVVSLWQQNCYCICSEGAVTGIALVQGLNAAHVTRTVLRGKNRWARIWLVVNHQGWGRWCTEALKVHRSAVQAVHTGQKGLSLCGSCSGCGVILEDHDKYYTFSPSRRASAFCLIYAPPSPLLTDSTEVCCKTFCEAKSKSKGSDMQAWKKVSYSVSEKYGWRLKDLLSNELILSLEVTVF